MAPTVDFLPVNTGCVGSVKGDLKWTPKDASTILQPFAPVPPVERKLGETETSYFLPSRESGVNDMYLHLGCRAPAHLVERQRVSLVWAIMRMKHPLLASKVQMNSYEDIVFVYNAPQSPSDTVTVADQSLEYRLQSKDDLIDEYLNGPRTLSNERLSYLIVSCDDQSDEIEKSYDFLICATHFLGDGMALHQFANDLFSLLGSPLDLAGLREKLSAEWSERCFKGPERAPTLPSSMEDRLPAVGARGLGRLGTRVDFNNTQQKLIGGHTFPREPRGTRHTIVPTISIDREKTKKILGNCKRRGVSISSALFAICNIAWARTHSTNWELPIMMYSALNMRPNLTADKRLNDSYWFLAIGYFNVVLPTFFPQEGDLTGTFWHRARSAKIQSAKAAKSPLSVPRCREMARERGERARIWAKEDDDKAMGIPPKPSVPVAAAVTPSKPKIPSNALMGLSLLGNLDGMYKHSAFPDLKLHTLTTGSRQRSGGMLLFGYTFVEKLWVSFGYDENGFEEDTVKRFWKNVIDAVDEFLLP
ncbi:hypothetical protein GALMADRAFT_218579 [Galerina marginata CBS 339.88]|uniref:Alcohol acetyltransferase n=1 Tax=Galerina marginata (strain CBS 339.88) TaxID=685588 RepID=A0A067TT64_GALM3|nr:hypothetical protein GALMADRAFT_218579 [Galerina marginata CBS 339.88]